MDISYHVGYLAHALTGMQVRGGMGLVGHCEGEEGGGRGGGGEVQPCGRGSSSGSGGACWGQILTGALETSCAFNSCPARCTKHGPETSQLLFPRHAKSSAASAQRDALSGFIPNTSRRWTLCRDADLLPQPCAGGWGQTAAQQRDSSVSQCDTSLLVPAESWNLCFGEMKHTLVYWDGTALGHSHTWLCLFHYLSFILWCSPYQKYNNNQTDRLNKPESLPKDSIKMELNCLVRSNKQKNLVINFPFRLPFYLI